MKPPRFEGNSVMNNSLQLPPRNVGAAAATSGDFKHEQDTVVSAPIEENASPVANNKLIDGKTLIIKEPMSSSLINDYLMKLTMFLVSTIVCSHNLMPPPVDCQKHFFQHNNQNHHHQYHQQTATPVHNNYHRHNHQYPPQQQQPQHQLTSNHEHILLDQRQALDHLMRSQNHHSHHHHYISNQQPADRRASASSGGGSGPSSGQQTTTADGSGKLLVCYYTTRQSAPYWPSDARSFVVPPSPSEGASSSGGSPAPELRQESGFAPMVHYEPFVGSSGGQLRDSQQQQQQQQQVSGAAEFGFVGNVKNQQQQLVFKSAAVMQQPAGSNQQVAGHGGRSGGRVQPNSSHTHSGFNGHKQYQESVLQMLVPENPPTASGPQQQQSFASFNGHNASLKSKQTPAYSFIGAALDSNSIGGSSSSSSGNNNGLIVVNGGHIQATMAPSPLAAATALSSSAGNNGFIISNGKDSGNNNNGHPERSLLKQQQQQASQQQELVFSPPPSLSRAFIVGIGPGGSGSFNNEVLDTKSQLFIPSTQQHPSHNNYYLQQQQQTTTVSSPMLYQQQQLEMQPSAAVEGKSLQVSAVNSEQLSPVAARTFSGPVSSAPSVPLSPASSTSVSLTAQQAAAASLQHQASNGNSYQRSSSQQQHQQQNAPFLPSQLMVVGNSQHQQQVAPANTTTKTHPLASNSIGGASGTNLSPLKLPFSAGDSGKSPPAVNSNLAANQPQQVSSIGSATAAGSTTATASTAMGHHHLPTPPSSLVSSPLSTMFDVFGAASQYLMRFKPSSLISPSSFVFNAINSNHHGIDHSNHHGLKSSAPGNSSSPNGSLIPLMTNLQKSSSSSSLASDVMANDRSSSSAGGASGILSRFSLSQNNNQRREDVCGRTIQSPQRRIIGGEGARYGEFPYQVHIKIAKHQCGGALVDKQSIVTAAHCVYHFITRAPVSKLQIVIGAYDIEDEQYQELPPQYFKVNKVKLHPNFRFSASHPDRYDIAILKLDKPVKYTDNVLPVCLPSKELKFESMVGTVTGFGKTDPSLSNRYGTRLLQKVDVPIIENNECERWHRTRGIDLKIFPEMMCAGYEDGLKDACVGDSGGPLVVKTTNSIGPGGGGSRWTLAGITSAGFGCAQSRQPGIYHRVSHTVDWILENLD